MKPQPLSPELHRQHLEVTRRYFMQLGATGLAAMNTQGLWAKDSDETILADATEDLEYLTTPNEFRTVERGKPLPYTLPLGKRLELGLERESWNLEVIADYKSNVQMGNPSPTKKQRNGLQGAHEGALGHGPVGRSSLAQCHLGHQTHGQYSPRLFLRSSQ